MKNEPVLFVVGTECDPEVEDKFNKWYDEVHIPLLLKFKGIKEAVRYRLAGTLKHPKDMPSFKTVEDHPKYLAAYRFDSLDDFAAFQDSSELAAVREDTRKTWGAEGPRVRWLAYYQPMKAWRR